MKFKYKTKCSNCKKKFTAKLGLLNYLGYKTGTFTRIECPECDEWTTGKKRNQV